MLSRLKSRQFGMISMAVMGAFGVKVYSKEEAKVGCWAEFRQKLVNQRFSEISILNKFSKAECHSFMEKKPQVPEDPLLLSPTDPPKPQEPNYFNHPQDYMLKLEILMMEITALMLKNPHPEILKTKFGQNTKKNLRKSTEQVVKSLRVRNQLSDMYKELSLNIKAIIYAQDGVRDNPEIRKILDHSDAEETANFFSNLQSFMQKAHKDLCKSVFKHYKEMPPKLVKQILYFDEEVFRLISSLPIFYSQEELEAKIPNWSYFDKKMQDLVNSIENDPEVHYTMQHSYAQRYMFNKLEKAKAAKDPSYKPKSFSVYLAPLKLDGDFDILLMHGNASHPLKAWSTLDTDDQPEPQIWPHKYLSKEIPNARIFHATYETFQQNHEYVNKNVPELSIPEIADEIDLALKAADIGTDRPLIVLSYSMGGVITKALMNKSDKIRNNCRGIVFYAVPHFGSDVRDDTFHPSGQFRPIVCGINSFLSGDTLADEEYLASFLDSINLAKPARFLAGTERHANAEMINSVFREFPMKTMSVIEGKKVYFQKTMTHYFVTKPESAYWPGSKKIFMYDKNHYEISKLKFDKDGNISDRSYEEVVKFIKESMSN